MGWARLPNNEIEAGSVAYGGRVPYGLRLNPGMIASKD